MTGAFLSTFPTPSAGSAMLAFDYRTWQQQRVVVNERAMMVATKPGVFAHAQDDPAAQMLASAMVDLDGQVVVSLSCGNGLVGLAAARAGAAHVWMTDRHLLAIDASTRTLAKGLGKAQTPEAEAYSPPATVRLGHGAAPLPAELVADLVVIRAVPERIPMHQLFNDARRLLKPGGRCLFAGGNHEGAKSAARALERLFGNVKLLAQHSAHRMVSAVRTDTLPEIPDDLASPYLDASTFHEVPVTLGGHRFTISSRPGVFSWEHLDEASEVLAGLLDIVPGQRVLDIGCGSGALGVAAAFASGTGDVCLVDEDHEALRCALRTVQQAGVPNARVLASDVASAVIDECFDVVVANPPFHLGKATNLDIPRQFIRDAHTVLHVRGRMLIVANRTLPYEAVVRDVFGSVKTLHDGRRFKVLSAVRRAE